MKTLKKNIKKSIFFTFLLGAVLTFSSLGVYAAEISDYPTGYFSDDYEVALPQIDDDTVYEERFDSRESGLITPVKNQEDTFCCWAFASIANFEHTAYKQTGIFKTFSEESMRIVLSCNAKNIYGNSYGLYHRAQSGGGTESTALQYLTNNNSDFLVEESVDWFAPNYDTDIPFTNKNVFVESYSWYRDKLNNSRTTCKLTDAFYISKDEFKKYIKKYGQVDISFNYDKSYSNEETGALYIDDKNVGDGHEVLCVGWDDNYSKENFVENHRPTKDGAWLVKNSWGEKYGDGGYSWVSYEDVTIEEKGLVYDKIAKFSSSERTLSYDFALLSQKIGKTLGKEDNSFAMTNVYDLNKCDDNYDYVKDVMFYTQNIGAAYDVYVVPLGADDTLSTDTSKWGESLANGTIEHEGYITANLKEKISVNNVDKIAVIVNFSIEVKKPGNEWLYLNKESMVYVKESIPSGDFYKKYCEPVANSGESFYLKYNRWVDVVEKIAIDGCTVDGNFCIRPTLVKSNTDIQDSTLSTYTKDYTGYNVKVDINLNGNALYKITDDRGNVLHQKIDYNLTNVEEDGSVIRFSALKSYFSDLKETEKREITFEFTDGEKQTLLVTYRVNVPAVYVSGESAFGQTVSVYLADDYQVTEDLNYQWQRSSDGVSWTNIDGANCIDYIIKLNDINNYLRCFVSAKQDGVYYYGQARYSDTTDLITIIYGDVNLDGIVNIKDVIFIEKYINDVIELNTYQLLLADVNGDGKVDELDKDLIDQYVNGLITSFPVEA